MRTKNQLAKALETAGWAVTMDREFTGCRGRMSGRIRISNGHDAHSFNIRAEKDGKLFTVSADEPAFWAIVRAANEGIVSEDDAWEARRSMKNAWKPRRHG